MSQVNPEPLKTATARRLEGVDLLRGLVMVIMVLDHTRDYFMEGSLDPTDLSRASPALFLTRWVTHFCAPTFALLAGMGARLAGLRGLSSGSLARFLVTRGLWLILLEQTVVKFGMLFRPNPSLLLGLVLWSIGGSFILLAAFVAARAPTWLVGILGAVILGAHNLFDSLSPGSPGIPQPLYGLLLRPGGVRLPGELTAIIGYPLIPWFGIVAVGYALADVYRLEPRRRQMWLLSIGLTAILLFAVLRSTGIYGDPSPWKAQNSGLTALLSFVNCTKYPPSLQYTLMTLGPALLLLAAFDSGAGIPGKPLVILGRVPLFFYLLQWYVIHALALAVALMRGEPTAWLFVDSFPVLPPASSAFGLPAVYGFWLVVLAILFLPCAWFAGYKSRHRGSVWLSYV
jgi:uncharacterized membrane protein